MSITCSADCSSFNEAAGIHRRKPQPETPTANGSTDSFNEAAGIHRRKQVE